MGIRGQSSGRGKIKNLGGGLEKINILNKFIQFFTAFLITIFASNLEFITYFNVIRFTAKSRFNNWPRSAHFYALKGDLRFHERLFNVKLKILYLKLILHVSLSRNFAVIGKILMFSLFKAHFKTRKMQIENPKPGRTKKWSRKFRMRLYGVSKYKCSHNKQGHVIKGVKENLCDANFSFLFSWLLFKKYYHSN